MSLYSEKIEALIDAALADGVLTEKEKQILFKKAQAEGIDLDEFEMVLDARLVELQKKQKAEEVHSAPKSDKFGDVRKCPSCGALVPALAVSCPECGYEFSGVSASSSSQLLAKEIAKIKKDASDKKNEIIKSGKFSTIKEKGQLWSPQKEALYRIDEDAEKQVSSLVDSFPVPNTKNDLFDLIMYLKTQKYEDKYKECLSRAQKLFPNDRLFNDIQKEAKEDAAKQKKEDVGMGVQLGVMWVVTVGLGIAEWILLDISWLWKLLLLYPCCGIGFGVGAIVKKLITK